MSSDTITAAQTAIEEAALVGGRSHYPLWLMYREAMLPLAHLAAQRHMLTHAEFRDILNDGQVTKYIAYRGTAPIGLSVAVYNNLEAWPLISPEYFRAQFPGQRILYVGFVIATEGEHGIMASLIERMTRRVRAEGGVAVADFCTYNMAEHRIDRRVEAILKRLDGRTHRAAVDTQTFMSWSFAG